MSEQGLLGDGASALVDMESGKVASAKNARRWPTAFDFPACPAETNCFGAPADRKNAPLIVLWLGCPCDDSEVVSPR
jgi:hypothetical protein